MKSFTGALLALALAAFSIASPTSKCVRDLPLVQSNQLRRVLTRSALLGHAEKLESFAHADPQNNRGFGGIGHKLTVDYLFKTLSEIGYYDVWLQEFELLYAAGNTKIQSEGVTFTSLYFTYAPSSNGTITTELVQVANYGCALVRILSPYIPYYHFSKLEGSFEKFSPIILPNLQEKLH